MASAKGARTAALWGANFLNDGQAKVLDELGQGYTTSNDWLGRGYQTARGDLAGGYDTAQGYLGQAAGAFGDGASQTAALEQTPGYQFSMDQGLQALNRRRAAGGMLNSGNADADAISFGSGLASQTLGAERAALLPYLSMYGQGQAGQAGAFGQQGAAATRYGEGNAGLAGGYFGGLASGATDYFGNRASVIDDTTKNIVGLNTEALKAGDAAKSANQAMMMQGVTAAAGLLGSGMGSGGMFTKMFGK